MQVVNEKLMVATEAKNKKKSRVTKLLSQRRDDKVTSVPSSSTLSPAALSAQQHSQPSSSSS